MASWRRARRRKIRGLPAGAWSLKPDPFVATGAEQLSQVLCGDEANTTVAGVKVTGAHTTRLFCLRAPSLKCGTLAVCWLRKCALARHPVSVDGDATFSPLRAQATPVTNVDDVRLALTMFEVCIDRAQVALSS